MTLGSRRRSGLLARHGPRAVRASRRHRPEVGWYGEVEDGSDSVAPVARGRSAGRLLRLSRDPEAHGPASALRRACRDAGHVSLGVRRSSSRRSLRDQGIVLPAFDVTIRGTLVGRGRGQDSAGNTSLGEPLERLVVVRRGQVVDDVPEARRRRRPGSGRRSARRCPGAARARRRRCGRRSDRGPAFGLGRVVADEDRAEAERQLDLGRVAPDVRAVLRTGCRAFGPPRRA